MRGAVAVGLAGVGLIAVALLRCSNGDAGPCLADCLWVEGGVGGANSSGGTTGSGGLSGGGGVKSDSAIGPESGSGGSHAGSAGSSGGFLGWASDPTVWTPLALPEGATAECNSYVADPARLYPLPSTWIPCGDGCSEVSLGEPIKSTRRVDSISLGTASLAQGIMPLTLISDTDYEFGGPPPTFDVARWVDLRTLTVLGAVRGGDFKSAKCWAFSHMYEDPRVTGVGVAANGEKDVLVRFDPDSRQLGPTVPLEFASGSQLISAKDAAILLAPGLSALFYDGKTVVSIDPQTSAVYGSGRGDLALWRSGSSVGGWRNDGAGARTWLLGIPTGDGPLSVAPERVAGASKPYDGNGQPMGTRFWRTDSLAEGAPVTVGPLIVALRINLLYAVGDWAVFDGMASDGPFDGVMDVKTFQVWRIRQRSEFVEYNANTFALDSEYVYFGEKSKKDENRVARKIVRYELAKIGTIGELVPPAGP